MTSPSASRTASPDGLDDGTVALRDHITLLTGYPFKSEFYTEQPDGVRLVRGDNVVQGQLRWDNVKRWPPNRIDEAKGYELREGDVVLAMDRPWIEAGLKYARIGSDDVPSLLVQRVSCLRAKDGLDQGYLFYLIGSHRFADHVLSIQTGTAVPHISGPQILQFRYRPLPLDGQRAIAAVLGSLDDKIEQNRRTARALERLARAIFRAWFVDFEPVKAKAAGATSFPSMPQAVFDALPTTFTDSELGPVPEGWKVKPIESLCDSISSGGTPARMKTAYWEGGTIPWFKTGELFDAPLFDSEEHITEAAVANSSCKLWPAGTILFALYASPTVGRMGVLTRPGTSNQAAAGLVVKPAYGIPFLLNSLFLARAKLQQIAVGAAQQNINQGVLKAHKTVVPPADIAFEFTRLTTPALTMQGQLLAESAALSALRDYLLPQLLSGQVPVEVA